MGGGEKGSWQGELFRDASVQLLRSLEFNEQASGVDDFDFIGSPPEGYPETDFCKPFLCPAGKVGFEFTSQGGISETDIEDLIKKVEADKAAQKHGLAGAILISDLRLTDKIYSKAKSAGCHVWDVRDSSLLATKVNLCKILSRYAVEIPINAACSFLWSLDETAKLGVARASACVFFQDPQAELTSKELKRDLKALVENVRGLVRPNGIKKVEVVLSGFTRSYGTRDFFDKLDSICKEASGDDVRLKPKGIVSFYVAPWIGSLVT